MGFKSLMSKAGSAALKVGSVVLKSTGAAITFANNLGVPIPGGPIVKSCIGMVTKAIDYKQKKKIELKNEGSSSASCSVMNSSMAAGPQQQHSWERQQSANHHRVLERRPDTMSLPRQNMERQQQAPFNNTRDSGENRPQQQQQYQHLEMKGMVGDMGQQMQGMERQQQYQHREMKGVVGDIGQQMQGMERQQQYQHQEMRGMFGDMGQQMQGMERQQQYNHQDMRGMVGDIGQQMKGMERQQQYNHNELTGMVRDMSCTLEPAMTTMGNQLQSMELQHETHHNQLTCRLEDMSKSGKADMIRMGNQLHKIGLQHDSQHTELTGMMEELSHSTQLSFEELSEAFQQVSSSIFFFF